MCMCVCVCVSPIYFFSTASFDFADNPPCEFVRPHNYVQDGFLRAGEAVRLPLEISSYGFSPLLTILPSFLLACSNVIISQPMN